jgi:hypothetical protein
MRVLVTGGAGYIGSASSRSFPGQATPPSYTTAVQRPPGCRASRSRLRPCGPARGPGPAARPGQDRGRGAHGGGLAGRRICEGAGEVLPEQCRRRVRAGRRDAGSRLLALMYGGLSLARAVKESELSDEVLRAATRAPRLPPLGVAVQPVGRVARGVPPRSPRTVIRWHRQGFRAFWTWKSRRARLGRPTGRLGASGSRARRIRFGARHTFTASC